MDEIILIPAGAPRLREHAPHADGATRLEMCKLAITDLPSGVKERVTVSDVEIKRSGESFAIDTVANFISSTDSDKTSVKNSDKSELFWIIGSDAYSKIDQWHRAAELKELVSFIVIDRPGAEAGSNIKAIDIDALDISATQIRSELENATDSHGVSPTVRKFISERKLYASK